MTDHGDSYWDVPIEDRLSGVVMLDSDPDIINPSTGRPYPRYIMLPWQPRETIWITAPSVTLMESIHQSFNANGNQVEWVQMWEQIFKESSPIPFTNRLLGAGTRNINLEAITDNIKNPVNYVMNDWEAKRDTLGAMVPTIGGQLIVDWVRNVNSYTGREIRSQNLENVPVSEQWHAGTTNTAKRLGAAWDVSPLLLDHFLFNHGIAGESDSFIDPLADIYKIHFLKLEADELYPGADPKHVKIAREVLMLLADVDDPTERLTGKDQLLNTQENLTPDEKAKVSSILTMMVKDLAADKQGWSDNVPFVDAFVDRMLHTTKHPIHRKSEASKKANEAGGINVDSQGYRIYSDNLISTQRARNTKLSEMQDIYNDTESTLMWKEHYDLINEIGKVAYLKTFTEDEDNWKDMPSSASASQKAAANEAFAKEMKRLGDGDDETRLAIILRHRWSIQPKIDSATGKKDLTQYFKDIDEFEAGLSAEDLTMMNNRLDAQRTQVESEYHNDMQRYLKPFWQTTEAEVLRKIPPFAAQTWNDFKSLNELEQVVFMNDPRNEKIVNKIRSLLTEERRMVRNSYPQVDVAGLRWGFFTSPASAEGNIAYQEFIQILNAATNSQNSGFLPNLYEGINGG